ncbi:acyl-CoA-binding domain-containing protein 4 isoform X3 [Centrocercus urophasianus]|uniref:acyl-CoA-binding domain-containing protein 4 isoform X3 n=1 Tax=Centrocercus urophasianus TaxID=9002 RepID=UPI001C64FC51|nr:acyl-CoA-binding domain-containing protein 4 isoform X3 [Centrocercus urophasianus]
MAALHPVGAQGAPHPHRGRAAPQRDLQHFNSAPFLSLQMSRSSRPSTARRSERTARPRSDRRMHCPGSSRTGSRRQVGLPGVANSRQRPHGGGSGDRAGPDLRPNAELLASGARPAPAADTRQGSQGTSDSEGEVFCDTMEQMEPEQAGQLLAERGLVPKSAPAGRVAGRAERGEGRRREGSGGADLAARGSDRDPQLTGAEEDAGSPAEPTAVEQQLLSELDAHVAGTVRALQDDMQRVLERLSELELLTSAKDAPVADPGELLAVQVSGVGGSAAQSLPACSRRPGGSVTSAVLLGAVTGLGRGPSAGEQEVAMGQAAGTGVRNASPCNSVPAPRP